MKKAFALLFALLSGLYLLIWGPMVGPLDPIPIIDEATALLIFVKSLQSLGIDISRFIPFMKAGKKPEGKKGKDGPVVDI